MAKHTGLMNDSDFRRYISTLQDATSKASNTFMTLDRLLKTNPEPTPQSPFGRTVPLSLSWHDILEHLKVLCKQLEAIKELSNTHTDTAFSKEKILGRTALIVPMTGLFAPSWTNTIRLQQLIEEKRVMIEKYLKDTRQYPSDSLTQDTQVDADNMNDNDDEVNEPIDYRAHESIYDVESRLNEYNTMCCDIFAQLETALLNLQAQTSKQLLPKYVLDKQTHIPRSDEDKIAEMSVIWKYLHEGERLRQ